MDCQIWLQGGKGHTIGCRKEKGGGGGQGLGPGSLSVQVGSGKIV